MVDLNVDTSSYPKPVSTPPLNPLDTALKVGQINLQQQQQQSNQLTISKQQLDLINNRFETMSKDFAALANDPSLDEDKIRKRIETDVKLGIVTPEMAGTFITQLPPTQGLKPAQAAGALKNHLETWLGHAQTIKDAIDFHYGQQGLLNTGNAQQPIATSPKFGVRSTGLPIANQLPTGTPGFDQNGQPAFAPPNPNAVAAPPSAPVVSQPTPQQSTPLPIARPANAPVQQPQTPNEAVAQRFAPQAPPLFNEGKQAYTEDQAQAAARASAMKPAEQALKLLPGLRTGPTTETFTKAVATLKAIGLIDTAENDPTVIRQVVDKKLAQYVAGSPIGQRSDAAQALSEAASPNPKVQLNPALEKLTKDALALDRVQIARPNAFEGNDFQNYGKHRATFPQSIDERAFGLGDMKNDDRQTLVKKMLDKYKKNPNDPEAKKFLKSYDIAKKQGFIGNSEE